MYDHVEVYGEANDGRTIVHAHFHSIEAAEAYCRDCGYFYTDPHTGIMYMLAVNYR